MITLREPYTVEEIFGDNEVNILRPIENSTNIQVYYNLEKGIVALVVNGEIEQSVELIEKH